MKLSQLRSCLQMKYKITAFLILFFSVCVKAESPDFLRSTGKINVVFAVIFIIFLGIIAFLFYLERKINKLEKRIKS